MRRISLPCDSHGNGQGVGWCDTGERTAHCYNPIVTDAPYEYGWYRWYTTKDAYEDNESAEGDVEWKVL